MLLDFFFFLNPGFTKYIVNNTIKAIRCERLVGPFVILWVRHNAKQKYDIIHRYHRYKDTNIDISFVKSIMFKPLNHLFSIQTLDNSWLFVVVVVVVVAVVVISVNWINWLILFEFYPKITLWKSHLTYTYNVEKVFVN